MRTKEEIDRARIEEETDRGLRAESDRLLVEMGSVIERGYEKSTGYFRHAYHNAVFDALTQLIYSAVVNVSCDGCRALAVERALKGLPEAIRRADELAAKGDGDADSSKHLH